MHQRRLENVAPPAAAEAVIVAVTRAIAWAVNVVTPIALGADAVDCVTESWVASLVVAVAAGAPAPMIVLPSASTPYASSVRLNFPRA